VARLVSAGWLLALLTVLSCANEPTGPLRMKAIDLGTAVDADGNITAPSRSFSPRDTIHTSIGTEGGGSATLHVRWFGNSQPLTEQSRQIDPKAPARFVFTFKPPDGWPTGKGGVVFWLNDEEKHTAHFDVR